MHLKELYGIIYHYNYILNNYNIDDNEIITVNEMKLCRKQICENAQAYISGNQVKFLNSSAAVYREAVPTMPLEEAKMKLTESGKAGTGDDL